MEGDEPSLLSYNKLPFDCLKPGNSKIRKWKINRFGRHVKTVIFTLIFLCLELSEGAFVALEGHFIENLLFSKPNSQQAQPIVFETPKKDGDRSFRFLFPGGGDFSDHWTIFSRTMFRSTKSTSKPSPSFTQLLPLQILDARILRLQHRRSLRCAVFVGNAGHDSRYLRSRYRRHSFAYIYIYI